MSEAMTRDDTIEQMYLRGYSMQMIGEEVNLSRERVRQILVQRDVPIRPATLSPQRRRELQELAEQRQHEEVSENYQQYLDSTRLRKRVIQLRVKGSTSRGIASGLGVPVGAVEAIMADASLEELRAAGMQI